MPQLLRNSIVLFISNLLQSFCNVYETLICKLVYLFIVFGEHGTCRYIGNINHLWVVDIMLTWLLALGTIRYDKFELHTITFGDELAFHRRGLCVSGSAHVTLSYACTLCCVNPSNDTFIITVELQLLEHWWLVYHGCFELVLGSLETNTIVADLR